MLLVISFVFLAASSYASTPTILAVSPSEAPNNFDATIVITGTDFEVVVSGTVVLTAPVVRLSASPGSIRHTGRHLGADTRGVLADLGRGVEEIDALIASGAAVAADDDRSGSAGRG